MYGIPHPVAAIRSRIRQEFERHRYVNKLPVVDILLHKSNADYQVRYPRIGSSRVVWGSEMLGLEHGEEEGNNLNLRIWISRISRCEQLTDTRLRRKL